MDTIMMILIPVVFFLLMHLVFNVALNNSQVNAQVTIIQDGNWPNASSATYNDNTTWSFGFNKIKFFADTVYFAIQKGIATGVLIFLAVIPPTNIPAVVSTLLFFFFYIPMYIMLGIGAYKGVSPFT